MVQINDDNYEDLTEESMGAILDALASGQSPKPGPQVDRQTSCPEGGPTTLKKMAERNYDYRGQWTATPAGGGRAMKDFVDDHPCDPRDRHRLKISKASLDCSSASRLRDLIVYGAVKLVEGWGRSGSNDRSSQSSSPSSLALLAFKFLKGVIKFAAARADRDLPASGSS